MPGINKHGLTLSGETAQFTPTSGADVLQGFCVDPTKTYVYVSWSITNKISRYNYSDGTLVNENSNAATLLNSVAITSFGDLIYYDSYLWVATGVDQTTAYIFKIDPTTLTYVTHYNVTASLGAQQLNSCCRYNGYWYIGIASFTSQPYFIDIYNNDFSSRIGRAYTSPGNHQYGLQSLAVWGRYFIGGMHRGTVKVWYAKDDGTLEVVQEYNELGWTHADGADSQGIDVIGDELWIADRQHVTATTVYRYNIAEKTSGVWLPTRLDPGLWLDADDSTVFTLSGSNVTRWGDKSWASRDVKQATASLKPTRQTNVINGRAVVRYDGTDDLLANTDGTYMLRNSPGYAVFAVLSHVTQATSNRNWIFVSNGLATARFSAYFTPTTRLSSAGGRRLDADAYLGASEGSDFGGSPQLIGVTVDLPNTDLYLYKNGTVTASNTSWYGPANTEATGGDLWIGHSGSIPWQGDIGEIIFLEYVPDTSTRQLVEGWLAWRWGLQGSLPGGHPYLSAAPALDVTASVLGSRMTETMREKMLRKRMRAHG